MLSPRRIAFLVILALAVVSGGPAATAQTLSNSDLAVTRTAFSAGEAGDWNRAYVEAGAIKDPLPFKMLRWLDYASPGAPGRFADIADFIEKNPDWPHQKALRQHAEEALSGESDAIAAAWFKTHPPISAAGQVRAAEILLNSGDIAGGTGALRAAWINGDFNPPDEKRFLAADDPGAKRQREVLSGLDIGLRLLRADRAQARRRIKARINAAPHRRLDVLVGSALLPLLGETLAEVV